MTAAVSGRVVQLKCPVGIEGSTVDDDVRPISIQLDIEIKVLRPPPSFVQEEFVIHGQTVKYKGHSRLEVVIFAVGADSNVVEVSTPLRCKPNGNFAKLLAPQKIRPMFLILCLE